MARFLHRFCSGLFCRVQLYMLFVFWTFGLMFGAAFVSESDMAFQELIREAAVREASVSVLLINALLPLLSSLFAGLFLNHLWVYPICFFRGVSYGFISCGVFSAFSAAGWMIRWLLLFSGTVCNVLLFLIWIGFLIGKKRNLFPLRLAPLFGVLVFTVYFDCSYVAPMLRAALV